MVFRRLSATGIRFSAILFPPGSWALLTVGLPAKTAGPRRGYRVPHARATTGVGALYTPRYGGAHPGPGGLPSRRLPLDHGESFHAAPTSHLARLRLTRHQRGFKQFTRPVFPSPATARMERAAAWAFPRASHPADQEPYNARRGGDRPSSTDLELPAQHHIGLILQFGSSHNACDLASHGEERVSASRAASPLLHIQTGIRRRDAARLGWPGRDGPRCFGGRRPWCWLGEPL